LVNSQLHRISNILGLPRTEEIARNDIVILEHLQKWAKKRSDVAEMQQKGLHRHICVIPDRLRHWRRMPTTQMVGAEGQHFDLVGYVVGRIVQIFSRSAWVRLHG